jgi:hypothetical protein
MLHDLKAFGRLASVVISTRRCEGARKAKISTLLLRCTMLFDSVRCTSTNMGDNEVLNCLWAPRAMGSRNVYTPSGCDSQPVRTLHASLRDAADRRHQIWANWLGYLLRLSPW